jgi:cytochrome c-type biogenesis protein CcmH
MAAAALCLLAASACTPKQEAAATGKITGVITVDPTLASKLKPTDVLYIIARGQQTGPPAAVKRVTDPKFPLRYVIGPEDAMMPGVPGFEGGGRLTIAARLSRTGNAMPAAGDLEGVFTNNPAKPGDAGVDVVISKERN